MTDLFTRALVGTKYQSRRNDLLSDGYRILFEHTDEIGVFCKLRHRNGTIITLKCDYGERSIIQQTNGKTTHFEKVCES